MSCLISIVVPIYNVEGYIEECLNSVLSQSYRNIEVICVDDCGKDRSMQIVEHFAKKDGRVKILRHEQNRGLGPARNTGIAAATGEYIFFLDSDDMLYNGTLNQLLIEAYQTNADVVIGRVVAFAHENDRKLVEFSQKYNIYDSKASRGVFQISFDNCPENCLNISVVSHGRLFKSSFLRNNELHFIDKKIIHEDNGFFLKYLSCLPLISVTDIPTIQYRIRPNSIMTGTSFAERSRSHLRLSLDDARAYIFKKYDYRTAIYLLFLLAHPESVDFICNCRYIFQLKWGIVEKLIRIFGITIYKSRMTSNRKIEHSLFGLRICRLRFKL